MCVPYRDRMLSSKCHYVLHLLPFACPIIASGGVASVDDIRALIAADAPIAGSILGRALYDGDIVAGEAIGLAKN